MDCVERCSIEKVDARNFFDYLELNEAWEVFKYLTNLDIKLPALPKIAKWNFIAIIHSKNSKFTR